MSSTVETIITSHDGTRLSMSSQGDGPCVVIVHGIQSTAQDWGEVAAFLSATHRCVLLNRRGREPSGPTGDGHCALVEANDLCCVLDHLGGAAVVGHSYGATVGLLAALDREDIGSLVLYEPALPLDGPIGGAACDEIAAAIAQQNLDGALAITMTRIMGMSTDAVEQVRGTSPWQHLRKLTPATLAELRALDALAPTVAPFTGIATPTTVLLGELSENSAFAAVAHALVNTLPEATLARLPGQHHMAHQLAPQMLARYIRMAVA